MNNNTQDSNSPNFILKGFNSIQIGLYFIASAYLINGCVTNFLIDDTIMMFMSIQLIEFFVISIIFFLFLFSSFALFYSNRRNARKLNEKIWNPYSKKRFWIYLVHFIIGLSILILLYSNGLFNWLASVGLLLYGLLLITLSNFKKPFYILASIAFLLAIMSFIIPTYWYSSILILGASHFVYGVVVKK
ncbi:MAG: hypothetical protein JXQ93_06850 [Flavobacteriaceae bacterium]